MRIAVRRVVREKAGCIKASGNKEMVCEISPGTSRRLELMG